MALVMDQLNETAKLLSGLGTTANVPAALESGVGLALKQEQIEREKISMEQIKEEIKGKYSQRSIDIIEKLPQTKDKTIRKVLIQALVRNEQTISQKFGQAPMIKDEEIAGLFNTDTMQEKLTAMMNSPEYKQIPATDFTRKRAYAMDKLGTNADSLKIIDSLYSAEEKYQTSRTQGRDVENHDEKNFAARFKEIQGDKSVAIPEKDLNILSSSTVPLIERNKVLDKYVAIASQNRAATEIIEARQKAIAPYTEYLSPEDYTKAMAGDNAVIATAAGKKQKREQDKFALQQSEFYLSKSVKEQGEINTLFDDKRKLDEKHAYFKMGKPQVERILGDLQAGKYNPVDDQALVKYVNIASDIGTISVVREGEYAIALQNSVSIAGKWAKVFDRVLGGTGTLPDTARKMIAKNLSQVLKTMEKGYTDDLRGFGKRIDRNRVLRGDVAKGTRDAIFTESDKALLQNKPQTQPTVPANTIDTTGLKPTDSLTIIGHKGPIQMTVKEFTKAYATAKGDKVKMRQAFEEAKRKFLEQKGK